MRIIAGSARGLRLTVPRGSRVRPTSGRVRTSLFGILGDTVEGARVADLFAGSGALGLEALSRGAAHCCFVEAARPALAAIEDNLQRARLADMGEVLREDAFSALPALEARAPFDIILIDPPYLFLRNDMRGFMGFLEQLGSPAILARGGLLVVQHDTMTPLPGSFGSLATTDHRLYGTTALTLLEPPGADQPELPS